MTSEEIEFPFTLLGKVLFTMETSFFVLGLCHDAFIQRDKLFVPADYGGHRVTFLCILSQYVCVAQCGARLPCNVRLISN